VFLNNRHYDPQTGVFVSVDPLVTMTGEPYIYGGANPITNSDPTGLCFWDLCAAEAFLAAAAFALVVSYVAYDSGQRCAASNCLDGIFDGLRAPSWGSSGTPLREEDLVHRAPVFVPPLTSAGQPSLGIFGGLFQIADDDALDDPLGLEELTGFLPDELAGLIEGHTDGRFSADEIQSIADGLRNPDSLVGPNSDVGVSVRIPTTEITVLINQINPTRSTAVREPRSRFQNRYE